MSNDLAQPETQDPKRVTPAITRMSWPRQADVAKFFGRIQLGNDGHPTDRWEATALRTVLLPYPMRLAWEPQTVVQKLTCHRLVSQSLTQILSAILALYGSREAVTAAGLDLYGGCYSFRPIRNGSGGLSMHSYGLAIDLNPDANPQGTKWKDGKGMMPLEVVDLFERAGWTWGGRWSSRPDCMHFQAASV